MLNIQFWHESLDSICSKKVWGWNFDSKQFCFVFPWQASQESQGSPGGRFGHRPTISTQPTDNKFNPFYDKEGGLGMLVRTHGSVSWGSEFEPKCGFIVYVYVYLDNPNQLGVSMYMYMCGYIYHTLSTPPLSVKSCEFAPIFSPELPLQHQFNQRAIFLLLLLITWQANGELGRQIFSINSI